MVKSLKSVTLGPSDLYLKSLISKLQCSFLLQRKIKKYIRLPKLQFLIFFREMHQPIKMQFQIFSYSRPAFSSTWYKASIFERIFFSSIKTVKDLGRQLYIVASTVYRHKFCFFFSVYLNQITIFLGCSPRQKLTFRRSSSWEGWLIFGKI